MKAVCASIVSEQTLEFEEFELPSRPGPTEVLVKIDRSIISSGTELANYTGLDPDTRIPGRWCCYPWRPGYGGIGRAMAVGSRVEGIKRGDRVYGRFNHASHAVLDTEKDFCVPVPAGLDSTTAAFVRMGNVAISAPQRATAAIGDTVVIFGLGLVGNLAGQIFRWGGQRVIGIDPASHRRALALESGFDAALDPSGLSVDGLLGLIKEANNGAQPRVVVEAVGDTRLIEQGIKIAAVNGQVILLGTPRAPYETNCTPILDMAHRRGISIIGALEWNIPLLKRWSPGNTTESNAELLFQLLQNGDLNIGGLCSHVVAPADLNEAYQGLLHKKDQYTGVVLDWENNPVPAVTRRERELAAV